MLDFKKILEEIAEKYDCKIWISEKIGKRWSFYKDLKAGREKFLPAVLLLENGKFGVFAEDFPEEKKGEVLPILKRLLEGLHEGHH
ncbi:hypothetical protein [Thermotoga sp. KOL6]|uniref:hypothetical protein n=1 Tax=Thermotoga sp. KOL6 TaxID=126741 RepID=UPI000C764B91|nr:hypothetical protein [Thermotoga sp. KOL6]PLV59981.1 hypothetical protein AS005_01420 [Thermotoga sp. KOL6]